MGARCSLGPKFDALEAEVQELRIKVDALAVEYSTARAQCEAPPPLLRCESPSPARRRRPNLMWTGHYVPDSGEDSIGD